MLNEYFEVMVHIITHHGGVVDKFIGDAIMAVWGVPEASPQDSRNAVSAALEMRQALAVLNEKRKRRGQEPLWIGMGVHCGQVISGTIGSAERLEYTVIGDAVNAASRIECATKSFGLDLLVSEVVAQKVGEDFFLEQVGSAEVKGKAEALALFRVRGTRKRPPKKFYEIATDYSEFPVTDSEKTRVA